MEEGPNEAREKEKREIERREKCICETKMQHKTSKSRESTHIGRGPREREEAIEWRMLRHDMEEDSDNARARRGKQKDTTQIDIDYERIFMYMREREICKKREEKYCVTRKAVQGETKIEKKGDCTMHGCVCVSVRGKREDVRACCWLYSVDTGKGF